METKIQKRKLGNSGLEVSAIGLGCMGMSFGYGTISDEKEMFSMVCPDSWHDKDASLK